MFYFMRCLCFVMFFTLLHKTCDKSISKAQVPLKKKTTFDQTCLAGRPAGRPDATIPDFMLLYDCSMVLHAFLCLRMLLHAFVEHVRQKHKQSINPMLIEDRIAMP